MAVFREKGYEATSIRDLETATGLKAPSLYNAIGNKEKLFAEALSLYRLDIVQRRIVTHLNPEIGVAGIVRFFTSIATEPNPSHGCMLTNTAVQSDLFDKSVRSAVQAGMDEIETAFANQLRRGKESGEVADEIDVVAIAQMLLVLFQGLLVLIRTGSSSTDIETVVTTALNPFLRATSTKKETSK